MTEPERVAAAAAEEAAEAATAPFVVFATFFGVTVLMLVFYLRSQALHAKAQKKSADSRAAKKAKAKPGAAPLGIHTVAPELRQVESKVLEVLRISKELARSWKELETGIRNQPGTNPVGLNKPKAIVAAYRVAALSIQEAFVMLRRNHKNPDLADYAIIEAGVMPAAEALVKAAPLIGKVWAQIANDDAARRSSPMGAADAKAPTTRVSSAGGEDVYEDGDIYASAAVWWTAIQKGEASNQKEMDAVLSAIDAVVLKLPEDVWGLDKLSPSQRMFITHQAGGKKNFQTTIQNRINMLFGGGGDTLGGDAGEEETVDSDDMVASLETKMAVHINLFDRQSANIRRGSSIAPMRGGGGACNRAADGLAWLSGKMAPPLRANPKFYAALLCSYLAIFIPFALKSGAGVRKEDNVPEIQDGGVFGSTFLELPPQYDFEKSKLQSQGIPFLYGVMHCALFSLGLLPLAMCRGFHRDLFDWPIASRMLPLTQMEFLHQLLGCMALGAIMLGALLWFIIMGISCFNGDGDVAVKACSAFHPDIKVDAVTDNVVRVNDSKPLLFDSVPGASYADPRDNVLMLREVAWIVWFFFIPLILVANSKPLGWLPARVKRLWWEICFYSHEFGAWITVFAALYARFEVFWPVIMGWGLLFLDILRERALHTFSVQANIDTGPLEDDAARHVTVFVDPNGGKPATIQLLLDRPPGFMLSAGQWCYLKVNGIDRVWHPFSIASASKDPTVRFYIGLRGVGWEKSEGKEEKWTQPAKSATWTYKLLDMIRTSADRNTPQAIPFQIRGPYGSPFTTCFDPKYGAAVLIGAGTGLASALSVLMEVIQRRGVARSPGPKKVWFVWSCRNEQQLDWCWRALRSTLLQAWEKGKLNPEETWNPATSNMIDWLGITIYVSQSNATKLRDHLHEIDVEGTAGSPAAPPRPEKSPPPKWGKVERKISNQIFDPSPVVPPRTAQVPLDDIDSDDDEGAAKPRNRKESFAALCEPNAVQPRRPAPRPRPAMPLITRQASRPLKTIPGTAEPEPTRRSESQVDAPPRPPKTADGPESGSDLAAPPRPPKVSGDNWAVGCADRTMAERMVKSRHTEFGANFVVRFSPRVAATWPILSVFAASTSQFHHLGITRDPETQKYSVGGFLVDAPCTTLVELVEHLVTIGDFSTPKAKNLRLLKGTVVNDADDAADDYEVPPSALTSIAPAPAVVVSAAAGDAPPQTGEVYQNVQNVVQTPAAGDVYQNVDQDLSEILRPRAKSIRHYKTNAEIYPKANQKLVQKSVRNLVKKQLSVQAKESIAADDPLGASFVYADMADEAVQETLLAILLRKKKERMEQQFQYWLEEQIVPCSMDDKAGSITHLLLYVNSVVAHDKAESDGHRTSHAQATGLQHAADVEAASASEIAVCFCGNAALAHMLQQSVESTGYKFEFATDSHAG